MRRHEPRGSSDRESRSCSPQVRSPARDDAAGYRLRLGLDDDAGGGAIRRARHRSDVEPQPVRTRVRSALGHGLRRPYRGSASTRLGGVRRAGGPHRQHRSVRAFPPTAVRHLLRPRLAHPARRRQDAAAHHRGSFPRPVRGDEGAGHPRGRTVPAVHHEGNLPREDSSPTGIWSSPAHNATASGCRTSSLCNLIMLARSTCGREPSRRGATTRGGWPPRRSTSDTSGTSPGAPRISDVASSTSSSSPS